MNKELLLSIFKIPSPSYQESEMQNFIIDFLTKNSVEWEVDGKGNIYNISYPGRPLLSAHMDTVQKEADVYMAKHIYIQKDILTGYGVIGADDKAGIYSILYLLTNSSEKFNFVFSVEEEVGAIGAEFFVKHNDLKHMTYALILDRKGSSDIICTKNEYGTDEFEFALTEIGRSFNFHPAMGVFSDADKISDQISCANLSIGYYNQHTKSEYLVLSELSNSISYVHALVKNIDMTFKAPEKSFSYFGFGQRYNFKDEESKYFDDLDKPTESKFRNNFIGCDACGKNMKTVYISTINSYICDSCYDDLVEELMVIDSNRQFG